ncbi:hypothetical protein ALO95_102363 [Pseudomonas syringae pv. antirrhini]|uniref:Uncharacterized protein n=1 Tax=Pseudomonas syringae pv. antirrhini TaxID=251702 RepID=A0A0P9K366_9PSED|nr:hypothetical protein ALO87_102596 [Pseudomonas syringae pv. apii]KPW44122.1 hypothetical protein ALO86_102290 [Pseudomonas syringae pv. berberidis]KPW49364.1 hypothetical protein ALO88_102794 [Pseudomonas syringae pv. antirrhini]KPY26932.1 hypothetical protein ALO54_102552 [Pseudomonas syringae pv. philadelphi]RMR19323.1 hypothetical protein ALP89_102654 [Pseudomonas syringae pv. persicae]
MQAGNVNGYDVVSEVWCDKCATEGARRGGFTVTGAGPVPAQPCQRSSCGDPLAELNKVKKK